MNPLPSALLIARSYLGLVVLTGVASAHVHLMKPNGGEVLHTGDTVVVAWKLVLPHPQENWDLLYSTTGPQGPWLDLALDLPLGDTSFGAVHDYEWTVPDTPSQQVYVRVVQDNFVVDLFDTSDAALTIIGSSATDCNANGLTDGVEIERGGVTDWDSNQVPDACQAFQVDVPAISATTGGRQRMSLVAGAAYGGAEYLVLGSGSGTAPGTVLGALHLPLNFDGYTALTLGSGAQPLIGSSGALGPRGQANAEWALPPGVLPSSAVGSTWHHAFVLFGGGEVTFASNAMPLHVLP